MVTDGCISLLLDRPLKSPTFKATPVPFGVHLLGELYLPPNARGKHPLIRSAAVFVTGPVRRLRRAPGLERIQVVPGALPANSAIITRSSFGRSGLDT